MQPDIPDNPIPDDHTDNPDASPIVVVPLRGKHGDGRSFVLDAADWPAIRDTWAGLWSLARSGRRFYVVGRYPPASAGTADTAHLARWMVGAGPGDTVVFVNGDTLDLRRNNLRLLRGEDRAAWFRANAAPAAPPPVDTPDVEAARALLAASGYRVARRVGAGCAA